MVEVGEGNTPGEYWWVVVWERYSDKWTPHGLYYQTYHTNAPGSIDEASEMWIDLGLSTVPDNVPRGQMWSNLSWTGDRLAQAKEA